MNLTNINQKQKSPISTPTINILKGGKKKKAKSKQNKENIPISNSF